MVHTSPIRGDFPSLKLGRMVRYHSTIERDLLYFCSAVVFLEQIMPLMCHLLFHHQLRTDLQQPFTPTALLEIGDAP